MRISGWRSDVCSSDPGDFPRGPALVQGDIQRDPDVSELETLLGSRSQGSQVDYGSLTAIPIDGGLIYVRPFYVTSQQAPVPGLERVIVYFEGQVVIRETLQEGLEVIFGEAPETLEEDAPDTRKSEGSMGGNEGVRKGKYR